VGEIAYDRLVPRLFALDLLILASLELSLLCLQFIILFLPLAPLVLLNDLLRLKLSNLHLKIFYVDFKVVVFLLDLVDLSAVCFAFSRQFLLLVTEGGDQLGYFF
jgi:hypothetical protein